MADRKTTYPTSGLWKDYFDHRAIKKMADGIKTVFPSFDRQRFACKVFSTEWETLELKERLRHIAGALRQTLPEDYTKSTKILMQAAPNLPEFENWALTTYVELFGLEQFDRSIETMAELTKYGTAEFAVRPFINKQPGRMLKVLNKWAGDRNEHVRRLAAEGSRPRGVWVEHIYAFRKDPTPVLALLQKLKADESLYVRKAVANNLNDISRDHPETVIDLCQRWHNEGSNDTRWIVRRACRTLIKQGNRRALRIFGFTANPSVKLSPIKLTPRKATIGSRLDFSLTLTSMRKSSQKLTVDFAIWFRKANGSHSRRLFKLSEVTLKPREQQPISGSHSFRPLSTRKYYPGRHAMEILINGRKKSEITFDLLIKPEAK